MTYADACCQFLLSMYMYFSNVDRTTIDHEERRSTDAEAKAERSWRNRETQDEEQQMQP